MSSAALPALLLALALWMIYCRSQRYRRLAKLEREYGELESMSLETAQKIFRWTVRHDLPFVAERGLEFALFATYAIPTISSLLARTGFLVGRSAGVRAEQTAILFEEFLTWDFNDRRTATALARVNWLHAQYGDKITNDDMLYTLAAAIYWPVAFCEKYDWRGFSPVEIRAWHIVWRAVGLRLGIRDIPLTFDETVAWMHAYEEEHQVYAATNTTVADSTVDLLLAKQPPFARPFGRKIIYALMTPGLREAFGYTDHPGCARFAEIVFGVRKLFLRYFAPPRSEPSERVSRKANAEGRLHPTRWAYVPLYMPDTDWATWLWGAVLGHTPGPEYRSEGYKIEEIGPPKLEKKGHDQIHQQVEDFLKCPFH